MRGGEIRARAHQERCGPQTRRPAGVRDAMGHIVEIAEAGAPVEPVADVLLVAVVHLHDLYAQVVLVDHREVVEDVLRGDLVPVGVPGAPARRQLLHAARDQARREQVAHGRQALVKRRGVQVLDVAVRRDDQVSALVARADRRHLDLWRTGVQDLRRPVRAHDREQAFSLESLLRRNEFGPEGHGLPDVLAGSRRARRAARIDTCGTPRLPSVLVDEALVHGVGGNHQVGERGSVVGGHKHCRLVHGHLANRGIR